MAYFISSDMNFSPAPSKEKRLEIEAFLVDIKTT
jgi:hypothetical protein